jgi:DNA-binding YbaB/EbfC family protein
MDLFKMMGQFKDMQSRMQTMQDEMSQRTFSALAGGGMVAADVDGKMQLKRIKLDPTVVNGNDIEMLEDLIVVAVAEARLDAALLLERWRQQRRSDIKEAAPAQGLCLLRVGYPIPVFTKAECYSLQPRYVLSGSDHQGF